MKTNSGPNTRDILNNQLRAMGADPVFELGVLTKNAKGEEIMLLRSWDQPTIERSIPWLKHQNAHGGNIYVRPKGEHNLTLVDDLDHAKIATMKGSGFEPAVVVETSPGNFQAWLRHPKVLPRELSTAVAKAVAEKFGADRGSADWRHFGRLGGFTNQKPKYRDPETGLNPFVRLIEHSGRPYTQGEELVREVEQRLEEKADEQRRLRQSRRYSQVLQHPSKLKSIESFREDPRYMGDGKRSDLAYSIYALAHGVDTNSVEQALRSRDLSHKGNDRRQNDYVQRTIKTALSQIGRQGR